MKPVLGDGAGSMIIDHGTDVPWGGKTGAGVASGNAGINAGFVVGFLGGMVESVDGGMGLSFAHAAERFRRYQDEPETRVAISNALFGREVHSISRLRKKSGEACGS